MVKNIFRILQFLGILIIICSIFISNDDFMNKYSILSLGFSMEELGGNYKGNEKTKNDIERCKKIKKRYKKIKLDEKYRKFFMCNEYGEVYEVILVPQVIFYISSILQIIMILLYFITGNIIVWFGPTIIFFLSAIIDFLYGMIADVPKRYL